MSVGGVDTPRLATCGRKRHSFSHLQTYDFTTGQYLHPPHPARLVRSSRLGFDDMFRIREVLGNMEDIKDYHKNVFLPKLEAELYSPAGLAALLRQSELKLKSKYGKYCVNTPTSQRALGQERQYFNMIHDKHQLKKSIEDFLIAPVQRIMRYQMMLRALVKESGEQEEYVACLSVMEAVADNTNTMMWLGNIADCPLSLTSQGELLKHSAIRSLSVVKKGFKMTGGYLVLFKQTLVFCTVTKNEENLTNPINLTYKSHLR